MCLTLRHCTKPISPRMSRIVIAAAVSYDRYGEGKVSKFERLLILGSSELPECRCGSEMKIMKWGRCGPIGVLDVSMNYSSRRGRHLSDLDGDLWTAASCGPNFSTTL